MLSRVFKFLIKHKIIHFFGNRLIEIRVYIMNNIVQVLSPTYKSKSEDFKRIFKDVPNEERLIIGLQFTNY